MHYSVGFGGTVEPDKIRCLVDSTISRLEMNLKSTRQTNTYAHVVGPIPFFYIALYSLDYVTMIYVMFSGTNKLNQIVYIKQIPTSSDVFCPAFRLTYRMFPVLITIFFELVSMFTLLFLHFHTKF